LLVFLPNRDPLASNFYSLDGLLFNLVFPRPSVDSAIPGLPIVRVQPNLFLSQ
jgi:hypothetical protein